MMPLVSIIIPVYKVEKYLDKCVKSTVSQSYQNIEIILVDDGSPDKCPQMCDEWAKQDYRIKVIHKNNGGLSDARNVGLDACHGDYIMFVDSDDYIAPQTTEKLYNGIVQHKSDIESCKIFFVDNGTIYEYDKIGNKIKDNHDTLSGKEYLQLYIGGQIENAAWNKLYKKECFKTIRFRKGRNNEDFLMFYELCKQIKYIGFTDYFGYYYRQREGSIVHDKNRFLYYDVIQNIEEIKNDMLQNMPDFINIINRKEIQERIIFMKSVLSRHKLVANFKEFIRNYHILIRLPLNYYKELPSHFCKPFFILRFLPFIYIFKS